MNALAVSDTPDPYAKEIGYDLMNALAKDKRFRIILIDGQKYISCVDLMAVFGEDTRKSKKTAFSPQWYWNRNKRALLGKDRELADCIVQLTMADDEGKKQTIDFAPLWACVYLILLMDTPKATEFKKQLSKGASYFLDRTIDDMKYRAGNIAAGMEWAADAIHIQMIDHNLVRLDLFREDDAVYRG